MISLTMASPVSPERVPGFGLRSTPLQLSNSKNLASQVHRNFPLNEALECACRYGPLA
jgi:hypothetical protein